MKRITRRLLNWLAAILIARGERTPYFHLYHSDGAPYMLRFWLLPRFLLELADDGEGGQVLRPRPWLPIAIRLHNIKTADLDRALHDHPWSFLSLVLRGSYLEARPYSVEPCFDGRAFEDVYHTVRAAGSLGFRRSTDRHRIVALSQHLEVWTLFVSWRKRQWWGFYTPAGKVHWRDFASVHNTTQQKTREAA